MSRSVFERRPRLSNSGNEIGGNPGDNDRTGSVESDDVALRAALASTQEVLKQTQRSALRRYREVPR